MSCDYVYLMFWNSDITFLHQTHEHSLVLEVQEYSSNMKLELSCLLLEITVVTSLVSAIIFSEIL